MRIGFHTTLLLGSLLLASCGSDDEESGNGGASGSGGSAASAGSAGSAAGGSAGGGGAGATGGSGGGSGGTAGAAGSAGSSGAAGSAGAASFSLTSSAYTEGATIPEKYECTQGGGENVSPPLSWTAGPSGTQSYAIVMRDLDFQNGFIHWVIWDIPASVTSLPEDVEHVYEPTVPAGAKQAPFNAGIVGYVGPCSPNSVNTYELTLYAIPTATLAGLDQQSSKQEAEAAIVAAATASAKLSGES